VLRAAVREVREETGITPRLGRPLSPQFYVSDGRPKRVDYWAATERDDGAEGAGGRRHRFVPGHEVDRLEWLAPHEAERRLSYPRDAEVLRDFTAGPLLTTAVLILRHASAGKRGDWHDLDALRPLDALGRADARELGRLLSAYGPVRVLSSATARCVETVLPYALAERVDVTTELAVTVEDSRLARPRTRLSEVIAAMVDGVVARAAPAVVCTHGEVVPTLVGEACGRAGEPAPPEPALRKGAFWVLHLVRAGTGAEAGLAAVERHSPAVPEAQPAASR
jgi:8-oxo-dGTP diphosphatase